MGSGAATLRQVSRLPLAEDDLHAIWSYVAGHDPDAADRLLNRIETALSRLADHPGLGAPRPSRIPDLRTFTVGRYLLFYQPLPDGIRLIRVLHGARDVAALLSAD